MTKFCYICSTEKQLSDFGKNRQHSDGLHTECKVCASRRAVAWSKRTRDKNPEAWRRRNKSNMLKAKYKMTLEDYESLLTSQNYLCKICGSPDPRGYTKTFAVDHDHKTGKVRGLLCTDCNLALGMFKDSPDILMNAFNYLKVK